MFRFNKSNRRRAGRQGVTLIELMISIAVLALMTAGLGALSRAVSISSAYCEGTATATQHARVSLHRIRTAVLSSFSNESFPGAVAFADTLGSYDYPDTLVVWKPVGAPANKTGLPKFSEIVVFCPNPSSPNQLLEITSPSDTRDVPAPSNLATWAAELTTLKTGTSSQKVLLTDLIRAVYPTNSATLRGAVRFAVDLRPSATAWASYRAGTLAFSSVPWAQTIYGSKNGLRQTWVSSELQLLAGYNINGDTAALRTLPFFGSAASFWTLSQ